jgi:16S rRNA (cytidine1402-2'-O)-methyltransferase
MPNTLYVVGAPAGIRAGAPVGIPEDLCLRARRILSEVGGVVASDLEWARRLMMQLELQIPLVAAEDQVEVWNALERGDVALLIGEMLPGSSGADLALIRAALARDIPVVPVPGPVLPVTALVVSGLPADSFVFLGQLPKQAEARRALLDTVAAERRTLIAVGPPDPLAPALADLHTALGDRPLVALASSEPQPGWIWRGTLATALAEGTPELLSRINVLVIGGATTEEPAWDEERLRTEVAASLEKGLRTKEIAQALAARSGRPRREIYRLAVELAQSLANERKETR